MARWPIVAGEPPETLPRSRPSSSMADHGSSSHVDAAMPALLSGPPPRSRPDILPLNARPQTAESHRRGNASPPLQLSLSDSIPSASLPLVPVLPFGGRPWTTESRRRGNASPHLRLSLSDSISSASLPLDGRLVTADASRPTLSFPSSPSMADRKPGHPSLHHRSPLLLVITGGHRRHATSSRSSRSPFSVPQIRSSEAYRLLLTPDPIIPESDSPVDGSPFLRSDHSRLLAAPDPFG